MIWVVFLERMHGSGSPLSGIVSVQLTVCSGGFSLLAIPVPGSTLCRDACSQHYDVAALRQAGYHAQSLS